MQGGADACDFIDIDLEAPQLSMLTCDHVERPIPCVVERLRIDLARLKVSLRRRDVGSSPIYFKARYLPFDAPERAAQENFEAQLRATNLFSDDDAEPSLADVVAKIPNGAANFGL